MTLNLPVERTVVSSEAPYVAYAYSYPHKSAYGPLDPPVLLDALWQSEQRDALFLYFHIPFCEVRCGFCNLFARAGGSEEYLDRYLDALERQAAAVALATDGDRRIVRLAIGGGTPTCLSARQLERLFDLADRYFRVDCRSIPSSVETSPSTATPDRVACLLQRGVERISIGVQSFLDSENRAIGRPQSSDEVHRSLERARAFAILNIDLIYGQPGQSIDRWIDSIRQALSYQPDELYLYPLYVRPRTGIGRRGDIQRAEPSHMQHLYREGRDFLTDEGYEQVSMRYFRRPRRVEQEGPVYCCQKDGMIGLGCGARSYTSRLHYSDRFAVESDGVRAILDDWIQRNQTDFGVASWGCRLNEDDRRRRFAIQSLLMRPGLSVSAFASAFGCPVTEALPALIDLVDQGLMELHEEHYRPTPAGLELSDAIGPALYSSQMFERLQEFALC